MYPQTLISFIKEDTIGEIIIGIELFEPSFEAII